jgi:hypothetical protein
MSALAAVTWAQALQCRALASDLLSLRPGAGGQYLAPLHADQRAFLIEVLTLVSNETEDRLTDMFERSLS